MNISLTLNDEQADALQDRVDAFNAGSGEPPLTREQFIAQVIVLPEVDRLVVAAFDKAVQDLGDAAKGLPYEQRKQLIASVKAQL